MVTNWLASSVALTASLFFVSEKQDTIVMPLIVRMAIITQFFIFFIVLILFHDSFRSSDDIHAALKGVETLTLQVVDGGRL